MMNSSNDDANVRIAAPMMVGASIAIVTSRKSGTKTPPDRAASSSATSGVGDARTHGLDEGRCEKHVADGDGEQRSPQLHLAEKKVISAMPGRARKAIGAKFKPPNPCGSSPSGGSNRRG